MAPNTVRSVSTARSQQQRLNEPRTVFRRAPSLKECAFSIGVTILYAFVVLICSSVRDRTTPRTW